MNLLQEVLAAADSSAVVVFDLDSTLLDNRPRQALILREFGVEHGLAAPAAARSEHWVSWEIADAMANTGLSAAEVDRWLPAAKKFWRERFFTSEYCALDDAIAGAVEFVGEVRRRGAQVAYCTGRHEAMRQGSVASFARLGFPLPGERVQLFMKPRIEISDDEYKVSAAPSLRALGRVIAAFDNEPTHINIYAHAFPEARAVHLATDHSGRPVQLAPAVVSIRNFHLTHAL
jgi:hypothetical protein